MKNRMKKSVALLLSAMMLFSCANYSTSALDLTDIFSSMKATTVSNSDAQALTGEALPVADDEEGGSIDAVSEKTEMKMNEAVPERSEETTTAKTDYAKTETKEVTVEESEAVEDAVCEPQAQDQETTLKAQDKQETPVAQAEPEAQQAVKPQTDDPESETATPTVVADASSDMNGLGTEDSPYLIYNEQQLIAVALGQVENPYKSCYSLQSDIELTADTWTPIGSTDATAFQGVFDGNGHTISSTVLFQSTGMSGIFGINKGTIKNLNITVTIENVATDAGALVATNYGRIENCFSSGSISATANKNIGGLVGYNVGTVISSGSSVVVTASNAVVGGLVGLNYNGGVIQYSYASGDVTGRIVGGLIGEQYNDGSVAKTIQCYSMGKVTGSEKAGGLIAYTHGYYSHYNTYIEYCYAKGIVASGSRTGGLVGEAYGAIVRYSYYNKTNTGNRVGFGVSISNLKKKETFYGWNFDNIWSIDAEKNEGYPYIDLKGAEEIVISGIGSQLDPYVIENEQQLFYISARKLNNSMSAYYVLANDITVTANFWTPIGRYSTFTGSFDGNGHTIYGINISNTDFESCGLFDNNSGTIKNLTVSGATIVGNTYTGAIVAYNNGVISNSFVEESTLSNLSDNYVGGMVGYNTGRITECGVYCDVVSGGAVVGGLVGMNYNTGVVQYSYASGDVTGRFAGGLIGEQYNDGGAAKTINSYSMGKVTGSEKAGGLIAYTHGYYSYYNTYIEYCYARGLVAGSGQTGGLIGDCHGGIIRYSYYNQANTGNKIGFSTAASRLKNPDTLYGWDFENIWTIDSAVNSGYPIIRLRGETPAVVLEGSGDEDDPYLIHNEKELRALVIDQGDYKLSVKNHYKLANDITVTAAHWTPIGANGTSAFAGTFDGDGHTISGIRLSNNFYDHIGLFGYNTGTIKNLNVEAVIEGVTYAGALAAYNSGMIQNCSSSGTVTNTTSNYSGGLVAYNTGRIELSNSSATVGSSGNIAGGLVGMNYNTGVVQYSYASGDVTGRFAGGLIGEQYNDGGAAKTINSYSMGKVTGSEKAGGLIAYTHGYYSYYNTYIEYCYARGLVAGSGQTGGLIGDCHGGIIRYSYYNQANTGNKIGFSVPVTVMNDQSTFYMWNFKNIWEMSPDKNNGNPYINLRGTIKAHELDGYGDADDPYLIYTEEDLWALVDGTYNLNAKLYYQLQNDIQITANYWTPIGANGNSNFNGTFDGNGYTISGLRFSNNFYDYVGFIGVNTGTIKNLRVEAIFDGVTNVGAICANNSGTVDNCSSTGLITCRSGNQTEVGGLVGYNTGTVQNSCSNATVNTSNANAGGLVGKNYNNGVVKFCYATGNVTGKYAGGLIGEQYNNDGATPKTMNSYSSGKVTGTEKAGGLIGYSHGYYSYYNTNVEFCYSTGKVSGNNKKGGLIGDYRSCVVTSSYYNSTLSEMSDIDRGTPLDDNAMKLQVSYVGWDFDTIWSIDSAVNGGYPYIWTMQPEDSVSVTGITLDYEEKAMQVGDTITLIARIAPADASNKTVVWTSSNTDVAYVSNGKVTAKGAGTSTITAKTADGSFTAVCRLTVTQEAPLVINVTGVTLDKTSLSITAGSTATLSATVSPSNATDKSVTWSSSNAAVASIDADGKITALKAGNVIITVKTTDGAKTATCKLTVTSATVPVTAVLLDQTAITLRVGGARTLIATVLPDNATNKAVTWTSSNDSVASVDESGVVTAKAAGQATIKVTAEGNCIAQCVVTVEESGEAEYIPGDINNDGAVNNKDLTRLMKYLSGEEVEVVENALDVNGDGNINNKDLTRLMKYLAGEDVELN
ncbi:MAG: Ig-like domain-containing protein [Acutalibacteraceae bacterium]